VSRHISLGGNILRHLLDWKSIGMVIWRHSPIAERRAAGQFVMFSTCCGPHDALIEDRDVRKSLSSSTSCWVKFRSDRGTVAR